MVQNMRVTILLLAIFLSASGYVDAQDWIIRDIYGDTAPLLIQPKRPIDLRFKKETSEPIYMEREKTLSSDLDEFIKETLFSYTFIWGSRIFEDPENFKYLFKFPRLLKKADSWQGCEGKESRESFCPRPFDNPPVLDCDPFVINFVQHPAFGATVYLYYRAKGYDRATSSFAAFLQSALFVYAIEGWQQPPSLEDLIVTPGLGIPLGIILEESSNWLAQGQSSFTGAELCGEPNEDICNHW